METIHTVRVRQDWLEDTLQKVGGVRALAEKLDCNASTISRYAREHTEAGPRFIGAVLTKFSIDFDDAFDITEEKVRVRRARYVKQVTA